MSSQKIDEATVFNEARRIESPQVREEYLAQACGGDESLQMSVKRLLEEFDAQPSFLEHPAVELAATRTFYDTDAAARSAGSPTLPELDDVSLDFLEPAQQPGSLGRLGQYEVLEVVGRGGMGIVLKAQDTKLHRVVAVKVLSPDLASNATARKRFLREAQAAAAVSHDHVVTIYAVEENEQTGQKGLPYLVMEFIDGQSLQQKIDQEGHLELKEILRIGRQVAAGLAAAHEQGLIHRDVKPANILLQNGVERVQITDFGLARAVDDVGITRTGEVTGTPQYMSPEQAQGHPVDARSDLFSLGSVLYAACTGRSPFRADTSVAALRRVCDDVPRPIREINSDIPEWLVAIVDRLLEKDRDDRFESAEEVAELLGKHLAHLQDPGSTPFPGTLRPAKRRAAPSTGRRQRWLVAGLVLVALATTFGVTEATGVTHLSATVIRIVTGEGTLCVEVDDPSVKVSIDGEQFSITGAGVEELRLRPGQYKFSASKDGKPIKQELVTITRGGRQVVRVTRESAATPPTIVAEAQRGTFAVLSARGEVVRTFDTLSDAVLASSPGDTIEIRGNGPIVTDPIRINHALVIRAGGGFRPVIELSEKGLLTDSPLLEASAPLALEGLELQRFADAKDDPDAPKPSVLRTSSALTVANCRFLSTGSFSSIMSSAWRCDLRNCEFLSEAIPEVVFSRVESGEQVDVENCLFTGAFCIHPRRDHSSEGRLRLNHNTFKGRWLFELGLTFDHASRIPMPEGKYLRVRATANAFDAETLLLFTQNPKGDRAPALLDQSTLTQWVDWQGESNAYVASSALVGWFVEPGGFQEPRRKVTTLAEWKEFWKTAEPNSLEGPIRVEGGDVVSRLRISPRRLTPSDFRLRPDSAGYQAGPDGKDIGADIDLVGPGEAYERWKQTPDYQEWQKQARQLMASSVAEQQQPFVVLSGQGAKVASFKTLADAVVGSSPGDTIEIRGDGPFVTGLVRVNHPLRIRAGDGFAPVLQPDIVQPPSRVDDRGYFLRASGSLVLEGLQVIHNGQQPDDQFASLITTTAPISVLNCRIHAQQATNAIHAYSSLIVRNCLVISEPGGTPLGWWPKRPDDVCHVENSVLTGSSNIAPASSQRDRAATARFSDCTLVSSHDAPLITPLSGRFHKHAPPDKGRSWLELDLQQTIVACINHLNKIAYDEPLYDAFAGSDARERISRWFPRSGAHNLYLSGAEILRVQKSDADHQVLLTIPSTDPEQGRWFIGESSLGLIRFEGGSLYQEPLPPRDRLTPRDFRLRPDSAGYQAGPDGKDLGANVDLVGPGEAYERWKQTPDYQEWLAEIAEMMAMTQNDKPGTDDSVAAQKPETNN